MKLNLHILRSDFEDIVENAVIITDRLKRQLIFPVIYDGETYLGPEKLYLVVASQLPPELHFSETPSIMCIGEPPPFYLNGKCNIVLLKDHINIHQLLVKVLELFHIYDTWEIDLHQANARNKPLEELARLSEPIFRNPIYMHDSAGRMIFLVTNPKRYSLPSTVSYTPKEHFFDSENSNILFNSPEFLSSAYKKGPQISYFEEYGFKTLYTNIFSDKKDSYTCRILVDELGEPITDKHFALIEVLREAIEEGFVSKDSFYLGRPQNMNEVLTKFLSDEMPDKELVIQILRDIGWTMSGHFFCVVAGDITNNRPLAPLAMNLSPVVPSECYQIFNEHIVYIFELEKIGMPKAEFVDSIVPHMASVGLRIGISGIFYDFRELYAFYQQALFAFDRITVSDPRSHLDFNDVYLDLVGQSCKKMIADHNALLPEALVRVIDYDREKKTDFVLLLKTYLECNMSATATEKKLFIHRNTFSYRIMKLKNILNSDLSDPDERLALQIALRLFVSDV